VASELILPGDRIGAGALARPVGQNP
jgi:hypothetical protein